MTLLLEAPMLAGSRPRAQQILRDLPADMTGSVVQLHCASLRAATVSFADELIVETLVKRNASRLEVTSVSDQEFITDLRECAEGRGVLDRLHVVS